MKTKISIKAETVNVVCAAPADREERLEEAICRLSDIRERLWLFEKFSFPVRYNLPSQRYGEDEVTPCELLRLYASETPAMLKTLDAVMELLDAEYRIKM